MVFRTGNAIIHNSSCILASALSKPVVGFLSSTLILLEGLGWWLEDSGDGHFLSGHIFPEPHKGWQNTLQGISFT